MYIIIYTIYYIYYCCNIYIYMYIYIIIYYIYIKKTNSRCATLIPIKARLNPFNESYSCFLQ